MNHPGAAVSRRAFVRALLAAGGASLIRVPIRAEPGAPVTRFGIISDIHHDLIPDALARVRAFVSDMERSRADFVIQLGDFCFPNDANRDFLAAWNAFPEPRYHVLGNHDMDGGFTREQTVAYLGMPDRFYVFDAGSFIGLVMDGNDPGGKAAGYRRFVAADQLAWLERVLATADRPFIVFIHQPLDDEGGVENGADVRAVLERANAAHPGRVLATFAGHLHLDYLRTIADLPYVQINSASYYWLGERGASKAYFAPDIQARYPNLQYVAAYREPLWAFVEVDRAAGEIRIRGRKTTWIGPSAADRAKLATDAPVRASLHPAITSRRIARPRW